MSYQPKYSDFLKNQIKRLRSGSRDEKKRAKKIMEKVSAVILDPFNAIYQKSLPENYCATEIGERFRLFFKPYPDHSIVYFSWINDESHLHRLGDVKDCYTEFQRLYDNGDIQEYKHESPFSEDFSMSSEWGRQLIYVQFKRLTNHDEYSADSHLTLQKKEDKTYELRSISVSHENQKLATSLLKGITEAADKESVKLYYELLLKGGNVDKSRHLLSKFGFQKSIKDDDVELWERA